MVKLSIRENLNCLRLFKSVNNIPTKITLCVFPIWSLESLFLFKGDDPSVAKILNWNHFQQQLIIKMTQSNYSFRQLYVVTETVTLADHALAVSASNNGEMELAIDVENFSPLEIFGHHSARTLQSKYIKFYHREDKRRPDFFKGKKLVVQPEKLEVFISDLIDQR